MMKKRTTVIAILIFFALAVALGSKVLAAEKANAKDKVASVNGVTIPRTDLDREMGRIEGQMAMTGQNPDETQLVEMRQKVLDGLIDRELLFQESEKAGVKVKDEEVAERMDALKKRFANEEDYKSTLTKMNFTEADLKSEFRRDLTIKGLIDERITPKVVVSDADMKKFYDEHPEYFKMPERVRASHILVKVEPNAADADKTKAREKMAEIQKRVKKGDDFAAVAKEVSDCPSSAKGGDLDYFQRGQMVKPFEDAAFAMKPGEISDVVETQFGYHLIKVTEKKEAGAVGFDEVKEKISQYLKQEKTTQQVTEYIAQLKEKAKIEKFDNK